MNIHYKQSTNSKIDTQFPTDSLRYLLRKYLIRFDFFLPLARKEAKNSL